MLREGGASSSTFENTRVRSLIVMHFQNNLHFASRVTEPFFIGRYV